MIGHRVALSLGVALGAAFALASCGLSVAGLGADGKGGSGDASLLDTAVAPEAEVADSGTGATADGAAQQSADAADGALAPPDAGLDAAPTCVAVDGGVLDLSTFALAGSASYNENADGKITLTNSSYNQAGAAWYPTPMPAVRGYDFTWSFRVGPNDTAGDGITFAVLESSQPGGVGDTGSGVGLRNIASAADGGVPSGYAVDVDMFQNPGDPTDLGPTTLKLVTMPGFVPVAETAVPAALNDGNVYVVDVSWRAPSTLRATLHAPGGALIGVASSDPGLTATGAFFGFTAATGAGSDSHNEIAGATMVATCE